MINLFIALLNTETYQQSQLLINLATDNSYPWSLADLSGCQHFRRKLSKRLQTFSSTEDVQVVTKQSQNRPRKVYTWDQALQLHNIK